MNLTLEGLPQAVNQLLNKLDRIEKLLNEKTAQPPRQSQDELLNVQQVINCSKRLHFSCLELLAYLKQERRKTNAEIAAKADAYYLTKKRVETMIKPHSKIPCSRSKKSHLQFIRHQIEQGTGLTIKQLKQKNTEERFFYIGLLHITTTKKAFCEALEIPVEAGCRYKRKLEKSGLLVQSTNEVVCPFTKHLAHLISTNPKEFGKLKEGNTNQLKLF